MTRRLKDSLKTAFVIITGGATVFTVLGLSFRDLFPFSELPIWAGIVIRIVLLLVLYCLLTAVISIYKYNKYKNEIHLKIGKNKVHIKTGDIFAEEAWRIIGVDTHFDTNVDDVVISRTSLHGQLVLYHGKAEDIDKTVAEVAAKQGIQSNNDGKFDFPLGTAIPYRGTDGTYVMVALTELDKAFEAHTKMPLYDSTMMAIWSNLLHVYAKNDLALPILGSGITRFDDQDDDPAELLRCMLCTLNMSKVHFKTKITIVIYNNETKEEVKGLKKIGQMVIGYGEGELPLYEYKDLIRMIWKR